MLEVYPEKVAKLSPDGFARIVGTLDFGLQHQVLPVSNIRFREHQCHLYSEPTTLTGGCSVGADASYIE